MNLRDLSEQRTLYRLWLAAKGQRVESIAVIGGAVIALTARGVLKIPVEGVVA